MVIQAFIFARGGSKGLPGKNMRNFCGKPLIAWSIEQALAVKSINSVIVSTDSQEIAEASREYGAEVPFIRPTEIAGDRSTDFDFIKHALDWLSQNDAEPDFIVHIRPTTPFRDPAIIDLAVADLEVVSFGMVTLGVVVVMAGA